MSDFSQNTLRNAIVTTAERGQWDEPDSCPDDLLAPSTGGYDNEPYILGQALAMLGDVDAAITQAEPPESIRLSLLGAERTILGLTPSEPESGTEPETDEAYRENPDSAFNQAQTAVIGLLDKCVAQWGFAGRPSPAGTDSLQHARGAAVGHILRILECSFGLTPIDVAVGSLLDPGSTEVVAQVPTRDPARNGGRVARVIRIGLAYNDGAVHRTAQVHQFVNELTLATRVLMQSAPPFVS